MQELIRDKFLAKTLKQEQERYKQNGLQLPLKEIALLKIKEATIADSEDEDYDPFLPEESMSDKRRLKYMIKEENLSLEETAERLCMSVNNVHTLLNNPKEELPERVIKKMARAFYKQYDIEWIRKG